nr:hypothetical protein [Tanacetum cinerariifolium]GFA56520.1 hypothetical protein [Tanacetum cinerariifolium]
MEAGPTTTMTTKLLILNPGEYDLWLMRIEQYFLMTDYSLWEVIKNGNKVLTKPVGSSEQPYEPTTAEEKLDRRNEMKARGTLLMGEVIQQEDMNLKLLRSLPSEWKTHALIWRNKAELETINNLSNAMICAFLVSQPNSPQLAKGDLEQINTDDLEEMDLHLKMAILTIRARRYMKRTGGNLDKNGRRISFDKTKVECFNYHKNGHFARECIALKTQDNRGREYGRKTIPVETPTENALIAQDGIRGGNVLAEYTKNLEKVEKERDELKLTLEKLQNSLKSLNTLLDSQVSDKSKAGLGYKELIPKSFVNSSELLVKHDNRSTKGYHEVPPPLAGNYMPPKRDLSLIDEHVESESVDVSTVSSSVDKTVKTVDITHKGKQLRLKNLLRYTNNFLEGIKETGII